MGSFHHNLLVNCTDRNWSLAGGLEADGQALAGALDISNNVVYNWWVRTTDGGIGKLNFVGNYYKMGAVSKDMAILQLIPILVQTIDNINSLIAAFGGVENGMRRIL